MRAASGLLYALAVLAALGAGIGGIVLMMHSVPDCTVNPYSAALGMDPLDCSGHRYPLAGAGTAVLVGGMINAAVIAVVGYLCQVVADLRDYRDADAQVVLESSGDSPAEEDDYVPGKPLGLYGRRD